MNALKTIAIGLVCVLLAFVARPQSMFVASTFNTNSTEGDFFGAWSFSFSTNNFTPSGSSSSVGQWGTASSSLTFTDAASGTVISVNFTVGGIESLNEFGVRSVINVSDPVLGALSGGCGDSGGNGYLENTTLIYPGQAASLTNYFAQDTFHYFSWSLGQSGQGQVARLENLTFNGASGTGGGTWSVDYSPVPEPATVFQIALGGLCLCLARYRQRRR